MQNTNDVIEINDVVLSFNIAKTQNEGEDADPVFVHKNNLYFLSVCDGMGGAGSTTYPVNGVQVSGAFISSRLVNKQAENYFSNIIETGSTFNENNLEELKTAFLNPLKQKLIELKKDVESKLKSKLLKDLPTTFSGMFISKGESNIEVCSIWAGDSRNYLFNNSDGLQQLSTDDLRQKYDPLENLAKDSPLDNVVSADGDFKIRLNKITTASPCILFTVTDGCYGYYNTPMQFEYAILQALQNSNSVEEWKDKLIAEIGTVAGDDYSISLIAFGYKNFAEIKSNFIQRLEDVYRQFVMDLKKNDDLMSDLITEKKIIEEDIKKVDLERSELQKKIWQDYKKHYLKHIV
jgi:serine/threonine protein phosphatase PrpC